MENCPSTEFADRVLSKTLKRRSEINTTITRAQDRSILSVLDLSQAQFMACIEGALSIQKNPSRYTTMLSGLSVALLFKKTSTRTRTSFELGLSEMGAHCVFVDWKSSNFILAEIKDEIHALSRYADLIIARMSTHTELQEMRQNSESPIINGMCDQFHPCQALGDMVTIRSYFGTLRGVTIAYVGDGNNVCHSLIHAAALAGINLIVSTPDNYRPSSQVIMDAQQLGGTITLVSDPKQAVRNADVIYTDTWISIGHETETDRRLSAFSSYQVNAALIACAPRHSVVMHCLPAHREQEITSGVLDSDRCIVFDQAENRKHAQKCLAAMVLDRWL